jgi:hypothetical protein
MNVNEQEMPKTNFLVKYDGEALANHEMDIALLAPALMGLQKLVEKIVSETTHGEYKAKLKVKGNVKAGSIEIELITQAISNFPNVLNNIIDIITGKEVDALLKGVDLVVLIAFLFGLIRKFGRRRPINTERLEDGRYQLTYDNETTIINETTFNIYNNYEIREAVYNILRPLEEEGIEDFSLIQNRETYVRVEDDELSRFIPPEHIENLQITQEETFLQIKTITFNLSNKWQFTQGDEKINANILDTEFIEKIYTGKISFSDGDILKVLLEKELYQNNGKLKKDYRILKVLDHIKTHTQDELDFD